MLDLFRVEPPEGSVEPVHKRVSSLRPPKSALSPSGPRIALRLVRLIGAPSVHCQPPLWDIRPSPLFSRVLATGIQIRWNRSVLDGGLLKVLGCFSTFFKTFLCAYRAYAGRNNCCVGVLRNELNLIRLRFKYYWSSSLH